MAFNKKTIKDIEVADKTVLLRADYNVPLDDHGQITDDYRIRANLPTLKYLLDRNCQVIIVSHLDRPGGHEDPSKSLRPVAERLNELIEPAVSFVDESVGRKVKKAVANLEPGTAVLLENLRFHEEEMADEPAFAHEFADLADVFVEDAFGVAHRSHALTDAITRQLPSVAGLLVEQEFTAITEAVEHPKRPLLAIVGGAKVSDKIEVLRRLAERADRVVVGGAIANTFFKRDGINIGESTYEEGQEDEIDDIYKKAQDKPDDFLWLPRTDVAVAKAIEEGESRVEIATRDVGDDDYILDLGATSIDQVIGRIKAASTVIWSGPLGYTELPEFAKGSRAVAETIADSHVTSVIGGGDTAAFIFSRGEEFAKKFTHVSTGGGAALDLIAGKKLPAVEALADK